MARKSKSTQAGGGARSQGTPQVIVVAPQQKKKKRVKGRNGASGRGDVSLPSAYRAVGTDVGSIFGMPRLGRAMGAGASMVRGHGDVYPVKTNSLVRGGIATPVPKFVNGSRRGVDVIEREFLGVVYSTTAFTVASYPINPGMPKTFPWGSGIAQFEQYMFDGLLFEFVSTSAAWNGSTQALGTVIMATDYDSLDTNYSTRVQMENADYSCSTSPMSSLVHVVECDMSERPTKVLYNRSGPVPVGGDIRMFDLGNFQIATDGFSTNGVAIGELWVSYHVRYFKKQVSVPAQFAFSYNTASCTPASPFGNTSSRITWGICDIVPGFLTLTFNGLSVGVWMLRIMYVGSSGSNYTGLPQYASMTNGSQSVFNDALVQDSALMGGSFTAEANGTALVFGQTGVYFSVTGPDPVMTFTAAGFNVPASTECQLFLFRISNGPPIPLVYPP